MLPALGTRPSVTPASGGTNHGGQLMGIRLGAHGRVMAPARGLVFALLPTLLLVVAVGCGTRQTKQAPAGGRSSEAELPPSTTVAASTQEIAAPLPKSKPAGPAAPIHRIVLSQKGCVQFEPQWTNVRIGQTITWHSDLRKPVRIYVSPGVFSQVSFLVRPGATVSTGPALAPGRYGFWAEPTACRDMPRGTLLAGPGVRVHDTYYASNP